MDVSQITALIGAAASLLCTVVVGALTFFMKKTLTSLEEADQQPRTSGTPRTSRHWTRTSTT